MKSPYDIIKKYLTEKAAVLSNLKNADSNRSVSRCENAKYTFEVDSKANKAEIAEAIEAIYSEKSVKVLAVNVINVKAKHKSPRGKMNAGKISGFKKAIVTLAQGSEIE